MTGIKLSLVNTKREVTKRLIDLTVAEILTKIKNVKLYLQTSGVHLFLLCNRHLMFFL